MSNKYYVNYGGPSARGWSGSQAIIPRDNGCVKLFWARFNEYFSSSPRSLDNHVAGFINTTSVISEISFKFNTGTITGTIKQYGLVAT